MTAVISRPDFRAIYQRHALFGLIVATLFCLTTIGVYYALPASEEEPVMLVRIKHPTDLPQQPTIFPDVPLPINPTLPRSALLPFGDPVPVPDAEANPEETIPTQRELSLASTSDSGDGSSTGRVVYEAEKIQVEEEPPDFVPVEKIPVPVRQVTPEYPEIARRAGVEGTVWVKILVDKEGKAKKALVVRSDAEIFNEPAVKAALQFVFTPAMMNNGPVAVWAAVPFHFRLNKQ